MTQFIQSLRLSENQFAILDMEAGVEHFGRGIDNGVDLVLMIIDPSYESLQLSKKVGELAQSIGKPFYYIFNKVMEGLKGIPILCHRFFFRIIFRLLMLRKTRHYIGDVVLDIYERDKK